MPLRAPLHPPGPGLPLPLSQTLSCEEEAPGARPKVRRPQVFLTASPSHPPRLPRLPFTGAALLAPGPGACAWVETASRWSYFFTFFWGGEGRKVWEKAAGTGKAGGRSGFERGLVGTAPVLRGMGGLAGKLRHGASHQGRQRTLTPALGFKPLNSCPQCNYGDSTVPIPLPSAGAAAQTGNLVPQAEPELISHSCRTRRGRKSPSTPPALNLIHRKLLKPHYCARG